MLNRTYETDRPGRRVVGGTGVRRRDSKVQSQIGRNGGTGLGTVPRCVATDGPTCGDRKGGRIAPLAVAPFTRPLTAPAHEFRSRRSTRYQPRPP